MGWDKEKAGTRHPGKPVQQPSLEVLRGGLLRMRPQNRLMAERGMSRVAGGLASK